MTFIEQPPQLNGRGQCSVPNSIFHCFVLTVLNGRCKLTTPNIKIVLSQCTISGEGGIALNPRLEKKLLNKTPAKAYTSPAEKKMGTRWSFVKNCRGNRLILKWYLLVL